MFLVLAALAFTPTVFADSGGVAGSGWRTERGNLLEDFRRYYDHGPDKINAVASMTDCDDTGQHAEAWYGEIRFLPE